MSNSNTKDNSTGFILMLDTSGSMSGVIPQLQRNACAFIDESMKDDQFAITQFSTTSDWIYPIQSTPLKIATVTSTQACPIKEAAKNEIEKIRARNLTNIGHSFQLGYQMFDQSTVTTSRKVFVLITDGYHNQGPDPLAVLKYETPLYIGGLGSYLDTAAMQALVAKNTAKKSRYIHVPNVSDMTDMFITIRGITADASLLVNQKSHLPGTNRSIKIPFTVSTKSSQIQVPVMLPDKRFNYTSGDPSGNNIKVYLRDPNKKIRTEQPIIENGYCIFNIEDAQDGQWEAYLEYSLSGQETLYSNVGAIELNPLIRLEIETSNILLKGDPLQFNACIMDNGQPIPGATVEVEVIKPVISIENALQKYETDITKLTRSTNLTKSLRDSNELNLEESVNDLHKYRMHNMSTGDILGTTASKQTVVQCQKSGAYPGVISDTNQAGSYTINIIASGINPKTNVPFRLQQTRSVLVG